MNFKVALIALGLSGALAGVVQAADGSISKKITLTANINDGLYVSKPDGTAWYSTEELAANNYTQTSFSKQLPVRVWSTANDFNVTLAQPLKMSNGTYEMSNAVVSMGEDVISFDSPVTIKQTIAGVGGYDQIHNVDINVDAPTKAAKGPSTNGSFSGVLVLLIEPTPSAPLPPKDD